MFDGALATFEDEVASSRTTTLPPKQTTLSRGVVVVDIIIVAGVVSIVDITVIDGTNNLSAVVDPQPISRIDVYWRVDVTWMAHN